MSSNRLFSGFRESDRVNLSQGSQLVQLQAGDTLMRSSQRMEHAYFPVDSAVSLLISIPGQPGVEVGLVGREGLLGLSLVLGAASASLQAVVQNSGWAWRVDASRLRRRIVSSASLRGRLNLYTQVRILQLAQSAACRNFHHLEERLARWLLMSRDRVGGDELMLTHELLAHTLGARRAGVTLAANALRRRELIQYSRGRLVLIDTRGLEAAACSCYLTDKRTYARFMR
jgi:CRP-like cAMP-binding protein